MDGFRRMLWVGRQHSADHIPVSALQLVTSRRFRAARAKSKSKSHSFLVRRPTRRSRGRGVAPWPVSPKFSPPAPLSSGVGHPFSSICWGVQYKSEPTHNFPIQSLEISGVFKMTKYRVTLKYGNPGEYKHSSQTVTVEANSDTVAKELAVNKFKNSNAAYKNKEVDVVDIDEV